MIIYRVEEFTHDLKKTYATYIEADSVSMIEGNLLFWREGRLFASVAGPYWKSIFVDKPMNTYTLTEDEIVDVIKTELADYGTSVQEKIIHRLTHEYVMST